MSILDYNNFDISTIVGSETTKKISKIGNKVIIPIHSESNKNRSTKNKLVFKSPYSRIETEVKVVGNHNNKSEECISLSSMGNCNEVAKRVLQFDTSNMIGKNNNIIEKVNKFYNFIDGVEEHIKNNIISKYPYFDRKKDVIFKSLIKKDYEHLNSNALNNRWPFNDNEKNRSIFTDQYKEPIEITSIKKGDSTVIVFSIPYVWIDENICGLGFHIHKVIVKSEEEYDVELSEDDEDDYCIPMNTQAITNDNINISNINNSCNSNNTSTTFNGSSINKFNSMNNRDLISVYNNKSKEELDRNNITTESFTNIDIDKKYIRSNDNTAMFNVPDKSIKAKNIPNIMNTMGINSNVSNQVKGGGNNILVESDDEDEINIPTINTNIMNSNKNTSSFRKNIFNRNN